MIQVAGYKPGTVTDFEVPKKRGLRQTIADTLGIGGIMRGLRTAPVLIDIAPRHDGALPRRADAAIRQPHGDQLRRAFAGDAEHSHRRAVSFGARHRQGARGRHRRALRGNPLPLRRHQPHGVLSEASSGGGRTARPRISIRASSRSSRKTACPDWNRVRYEVFRHFGYFVTESSEHFAEYVPWFIKRDRPDLIEKFNIPLDEYIRRCEVQIARWDKAGGRADLEHDRWRSSAARNMPPASSWRR